MISVSVEQSLSSRVKSSPGDPGTLNGRTHCGVNGDREHGTEQPTDVSILASHGEKFRG